MKRPAFTAAAVYKTLATVGLTRSVLTWDAAPNPNGAQVSRCRRGLMRVHLQSSDATERAREALSAAGYECRSGLIAQCQIDLIGPGYEQ